MKRKAHIILLVLLLLCVLSTTAFAIDESEVESAIAASSKEEVAGNVFIWFLCAIGFLKVSQKLIVYGFFGNQCRQNRWKYVD